MKANSKTCNPNLKTLFFRKNDDMNYCMCIEGVRVYSKIYILDNLSVKKIVKIIIIFFIKN